LDEISKAVKLQKPDKSPGEDGIDFVDFSPFSYQFTFDRILEASAFFS
jgi:hypothetical protein